MKRKLSAILALVLAVVMVFPTAVFVGAANTDQPAPASEAIKVSADGSIKADGTPDSTKNFSGKGDITIALGGKATGTITLPEGYTLKDVVKTTDNGAAFLTKSGNKFTVTAAENFATSTHFENIKITAEKVTEVTDEAAPASEASTEPDTITYKAEFTLKVNVVPKEIIEVVLSGEADYLVAVSESPEEPEAESCRRLLR